MHSLQDELAFLFSGKAMPYDKVSLMAAVVVVVVFTFVFSNNYIKDGVVTVIDLDNSKYNRELVGTMNASPFIRVNAVLNMPAAPKTLFYRDQCIAVVYLPKDLEKNRYHPSAATVGVFYDNTNSALHEIVAASGISLHDRILFNPVSSTCNGETMGFLFFFSSMFFVFATIGIIPRLRLERKLDQLLEDGDPCAVLVRRLPYGGCLLTALFVGLALLRIGGDLVFSGGVLVFLLSRVLYIAALGIMSLLFGWTAANPGDAASRMILFVPGGLTGPIPILDGWAQALSHVFPLVWEFHFVRDLLMRGASFMDCAKIFGAFLIYLGLVAAAFFACFGRARARQARERGREDGNFAEGA